MKQNTSRTATEVRRSPPPPPPCRPVQEPTTETVSDNLLSMLDALVVRAINNSNDLSGITGRLIGFDPEYAAAKEDVDDSGPVIERVRHRLDALATLLGSTEYNIGRLQRVV